MKVSHQPRSQPFLSLLVFAGVAAVAYADHLVTSVSLAYLYFLPLALSGFVHRLRTSLTLVFVCVFLSDWLGPQEHSYSQNILRNALAAIGFATVVVVVNRLTAQRAALTNVVNSQADELAREIQLAAQVQKRLLPHEPPRVPEFEIAGRMYPAKGVGGDYYDFLEIPGGNLGVVIADVSGKGVCAGLFMPAVRIALRTNIKPGETVVQIMETANKVLYELTDDERFVSLIYISLDFNSRCLQYSNAGHNPALLFRARSCEAFWLEKGGPVLGLLPGACFEAASEIMDPGDLLVLYTDGLVEAHDYTGREFSRAELRSLVASHSQLSAEQLIREIHAAAEDFSVNRTLEDDLTLVVLKASAPQ